MDNVQQHISLSLINETANNKILCEWQLTEVGNFSRRDGFHCQFDFFVLFGKFMYNAQLYISLESVYQVVF